MKKSLPSPQLGLELPAESLPVKSGPLTLYPRDDFDELDDFDDSPELPESRHARASVQKMGTYYLVTRLRPGGHAHDGVGVWWPLDELKELYHVLGKVLKNAQG